MQVTNTFLKVCAPRNIFCIAIQLITFNIYLLQVDGEVEVISAPRLAKDR